MRLRLVTFCVDRFYDFVNRMTKFGERHPEILGGFEKTCSEIMETARRIYEEIENKLELLHENEPSEKSRKF